jgi:ABC-type spermidine/putrescine transport system permease subunit II
MNFITTLFDYTKNGNLRDGFFNEFILAFLILWISSLIGLFLGWLMWRNCKKRCAEIEAKNARIRAKESAI